jgi:hypothetical protein
MNYVSNRNYGCRCKEIEIKRHRALILENNMISTMVLLDKGADIVEFVYKKTDTDFMWRSPAGLDVLTFDRAISPQHYVGGWFELFPNAGDACTYNSCDIPFYGDIYQLPWEYSILEDRPEILKVKFFVNSYVLPFYLEKVLTLEINVSSLRIDEMVKNLSSEEMHFTWGHHPNIGAPFLNEDCRIDLPDCEISYFDRDDSGKSVEKNAGIWPFKDMDGKKTDLRNIPLPSEKVNDFLYLKNLRGNWAAVRDFKKGLGFALTWDQKVFRSMSLWKGFYSEHWRPIFGHINVLCFLLRSSHHGSLSEAVLHDEHLKLGAGEFMNTWLKATVFENGYEERE